MRPLAASVPGGYERAMRGAVDCVCLEGQGDRIITAIRDHGSLERWACRYPGVETWSGRGRLYVVPVQPQQRWVVRRLRHGGLLARITGDRFMRAAIPRPLNELLQSRHLSARSVPTPRVVAACVYWQGLWYRGDVVREEVRGRDLARCLWGRTAPTGETRRMILHQAGRLVARLAAAGIYHPDLNLRNLLVAEGNETDPVYVLDLEKSRRVDEPADRWAGRMRRRLQRSAERLGAACGKPLVPADRQAFDGGFDDLAP